MTIEIIQQIKSTISPKSIRLESGEFIHFWYSNNRGRGSNNVTIIRSRKPRAALSSQQTDVIAITKTSGWSGKVNFSKKIQKTLGF